MSRTPERSPSTVHGQRDALVADMSRLVRRALGDTLARYGADGADHVALIVERSREPIAPARMAQEHPGPDTARQQARELYDRCLQHYRNVVRACDVERDIDDVGAAVAHFVAANLYALRCIGPGGNPPLRITTRMLLRVERQLSAIVGEGTVWQSASAADRQYYFEQTAILAVLIGETARHAAAQGPAAVANVQRAARGYLEQLIGINPDLLTLGPDGLALAAADSSRRSRRSRPS